MKKVNTDKIVILNFLISIVLYMSILLPLTLWFGVSMAIFPITILAQVLLVCGLLVYFFKKSI